MTETKIDVSSPPDIPEGSSPDEDSTSSDRANPTDRFVAKMRRRANEGRKDFAHNVLTYMHGRLARQDSAATSQPETQPAPVPSKESSDSTTEAREVSETTRESSRNRILQVVDAFMDQPDPDQNMRELVQEATDKKAGVRRRTRTVASDERAEKDAIQVSDRTITEENKSEGDTDTDTSDADIGEGEHSRRDVMISDYSLTTDADGRRVRKSLEVTDDGKVRIITSTLRGHWRRAVLSEDDIAQISDPEERAAAEKNFNSEVKNALAAISPEPYKRFTEELDDGTRVVPTTQLTLDNGTTVPFCFKVDDNDLPIPPSSLPNPHFSLGGDNADLGVIVDGKFVSSRDRDSLMQAGFTNQHPIDMVGSQEDPLAVSPTIQDVVDTAAKLCARDWSPINSRHNADQLASIAAGNATWVFTTSGLLDFAEGESFRDTSFFAGITSALEDDRVWDQVNNPTGGYYTERFGSRADYLASLVRAADNRDDSGSRAPRFVTLKNELSRIITVMVHPAAEQVLKDHEEEIAAMDAPRPRY